MPTTVNFIIETEVISVEERFINDYVSGFGDTAVFDSRSIGWFLWLKGSYEALHLGMEKPEMKKGDKVKITIERVS